MPLARPLRSKRETVQGVELRTKRAASDRLEKTRRRGREGEEAKRTEETSRAEPSRETFRRLWLFSLSGGRVAANCWPVR